MREQFNDRNQYSRQQNQYPQQQQWSGAPRGDWQSQERSQQGRYERGPEWQNETQFYGRQNEQLSGGSTGWSDDRGEYSRTGQNDPSYQGGRNEFNPYGQHSGGSYGQGVQTGQYTQQPGQINQTGQYGQYGQAIQYGQGQYNPGQYNPYSGQGQHPQYSQGQYNPYAGQSGQYTQQTSNQFGQGLPYGQYGNQLGLPFGSGYGLQGQPTEWERSYGRSAGGIGNYGTGLGSSSYEGGSYGTQDSDRMQGALGGYNPQLSNQFGRSGQTGAYGSSLSGQTSYRGRGPKNYTRSDERITEDLNERLSDDDLIDASNINVSIKEGVATLTGTVEHRWMKHRAEDLVGACSGVKDVDNQLRVVQSSGIGMSSRSGSGSNIGSGSTSSTNTNKTKTSGESGTSSH